MSTYAAAAKQPDKKQKEQAEKEKQAQKKKKLYELSESEDEEKSDDDNTSNTSKKREREGETLVQRNKKAERDKSMETDEEIAILGVKPGVLKKPAAKKTTTQVWEESLPEAWKMVNSKSANRRQFNPEGRDTTPDRTNRNLSRFPNKTRITLKLQVQASERPHQEVTNNVKAFVKEILKADGKAAILPWKQANEHKGAIRKASNLPDNSYELRDYLADCWTPKEGEKRILYPHIYIGHTESLEDIRKTMGEYLSSSKQAMYNKMLQVEESVIAGFLVYSHNDMDAGALADEIGDQIGIPVGLRWRAIDIGIKGKIPDNQKVNALHVEVEKKSKMKAMKKLFELYPRTMVNTHLYPNGIKMRFVKNKSDALNIPEKRKIEKLRARQEKFSKKVRRIENWDIMILDAPSSDHMAPSLRQMIMSIPSKIKPGTPVFHSVDLDWKGSGFNYLVAPALLEEAQCIVPHILCVIKELFPAYYEHATTCMTLDALEICETLKYDIDSGNIYDKLDDTEEVEIDDAFDLLGFETTDMENQIGPTQRPVSTNERDYMPGDDDSISTFGGNKGGSFVKGFITSNRRTHNESEYDTSSTSTLTLSTQRNDNMDAVQKELAEVKRKLQLAETQNEQLLQKVPQAGSGSSNIQAFTQPTNNISNQTESGSYPNSFAKIGSSTNVKSEGRGTIPVTPAKGLH
jgi:hypothetical protein